MPIISGTSGEITGAGVQQQARSLDRTLSVESNSTLVQSVIGVSSDGAARPEPAAAAGPSVVYSTQDGDEAVPTQSPSRMEANLEQVSTNSGGRSEWFSDARARWLANEGANGVAAKDIARSQLQQVTDDVITACLDKLTPYDQMESDLNALGKLPRVDELGLDALNDVNDRMSAAQEMAGNRLSPNSPADPESGPEIGSTGAAPAGQTAASNAIEHLSCKNQFREKALKNLFSQAGDSQAVSLAGLYAKSTNAYAQLTVLNFAEVFKASCDKVELSDADGGIKSELLKELQNVAKDYIALIQNDGLDTKSSFGAFYLGHKSSRKERVKLEETLLRLSGAETPPGRKELQDAMWMKEVQPYVQKFLNEKFGCNIEDVDQLSCQAIVDNKAAEATSKIFGAMEEYSLKNGTSVNSIAGGFELITLWPELMRKFNDDAPLPATDATEPAVAPEADSDSSASKPIPAPRLSLTKKKPLSEQAEPPQPFIETASTPGPAKPAQGEDVNGDGNGGGRSHITNITNNFVNNNNNNNNGSFNSDVNGFNAATDGKDFSSGDVAFGAADTGRPYPVYKPEHDAEGAKRPYPAYSAGNDVVQNRDVVERSAVNESKPNLIDFKEIAAESLFNYPPGEIGSYLESDKDTLKKLFENSIGSNRPAKSEEAPLAEMDAAIKTVEIRPVGGDGERVEIGVYQQPSMSDVIFNKKVTEPEALETIPEARESESESDFESEDYYSASYTSSPSDLYGSVSKISGAGDAIKSQHGNTDIEEGNKDNITFGRFGFQIQRGEDASLWKNVAEKNGVKKSSVTMREPAQMTAVTLKKNSSGNISNRTLATLISSVSTPSADTVAANKGPVELTLNRAIETRHIGKAKPEWTHVPNKKATAKILEIKEQIAKNKQKAAIEKASALGTEVEQSRLSRIKCNLSILQGKIDAKNSRSGTKWSRTRNTLSLTNIWEMRALENNLIK